MRALDASKMRVDCTVERWRTIYSTELDIDNALESTVEVRLSSNMMRVVVAGPCSGYVRLCDR